MSTALASLGIYLAWGVFSNALGFTWDSWQFWCGLGLLWAAEQIGKSAGREEIVGLIADEIDKNNKKET